MQSERRQFGPGEVAGTLHLVNCLHQLHFLSVKLMLDLAPSVHDLLLLGFEAFTLLHVLLDLHFHFLRRMFVRAGDSLDVVETLLSLDQGKFTPDEGLLLPILRDQSHQHFLFFPLVNQLLLLFLGILQHLLTDALLVLGLLDGLHLFVLDLLLFLDGENFLPAVHDKLCIDHPLLLERFNFLCVLEDLLHLFRFLRRLLSHFEHLGLSLLHK